MSVGCDGGRGRGLELRHEILHLEVGEDLAGRDGSGTCQGECQAAVNSLGIEGTTLGDRGQEVEQQTLRVNAFETGGEAMDGYAVATEGVDLKTSGMEVGLDGVERGGISGREVYDVGEEEALGDTVAGGELGEVAVVEDAEVSAVLIDEHQTCLNREEDILAAILEERRP